MSDELPPGTRTFTHAEAQALLPRVRELMETAVTSRVNVERVLKELHSIEADRTRENALSLARTLREKRGELGTYIHDLQMLVDEVQEIGCLIKGFDPVLVDFPTLHQGRIVLLCWKFGEPSISYWHETSGNFYTRQPIISNEGSQANS